MSFLTLNGTPVRCKRDASDVKDVWHRQDMARAFDGQVRQTRGPLFREFTIQTALQTDADYLALRAILNSDSLPLVADGDLIGDGPINVTPRDVTWTPLQSASGFRRQAKFTLWEDLGAISVLGDLVFDYAADDAVTTPAHITPFAGGGFDADTVTGIPDRVTGPSLNPEVLIDPAGWFDDNDNVGGHALIRAWGGADNAPLLATLSSPLTGLTGVTIMIVGRPGDSVVASIAVLVRDTSGSGGSPVGVLGLGVYGAGQQIGGWRRGSPLGETGEGSMVNGGTLLSSSDVYDGAAPDDVNDATSGEGTPPGGDFTIAAVRRTNAGVVSFFKNGTICPLTFSGPSGPFEIADLSVFTNFAGVGAGEAFDLVRMLVWQRALTSDEIAAETASLADLYGIPT